MVRILSLPLSRYLLAFAVGLWFCLPAQAQVPAQERKPQQFVYVLRVAPKYHDEASWKDAERQAVGRHFARLAKATQEGKVILAGRSAEPLAQTFGLVIFEGENEAEARAFVEADPAVQAGLMTATLHPYSVALLRKPAS